MSAPERCFAGHDVVGEGFVVSRPANPLLAPVTACADHVGDLLGNVAKSTLRSGIEVADVRVTRLVQPEPQRPCECHAHREQRRATPRHEGESPYDYARRLAGQPAPRG